MSLEKFKETKPGDIPLGKLVGLISKSFTYYVNQELKSLEINETQLSYLIEIKFHKGINQHEVASNCNIDKGAVARSLRKLEEQGLILRKVDDENRRQNNIFLTEKGNETLEKSKEILDKWDFEIYEGINQKDKEKTHEVLKKLVLKSFEMNQNLKNE